MARKLTSDLIDLSQLTLVNEKIEERRPCLRCKGEGFLRSLLPGVTDRSCFYCGGACIYPRPNFVDIINHVTSVVGGKSRLRSARPERGSSMNDARYYYVWRIARFHGGMDVTLPMMAELEIAGDPYRKELEALAEAVARIWLGNDTTGALRWGPLLGACTQEEARSMAQRTNANPLTAEPCGPVVLGPKPEEERGELR